MRRQMQHESFRCGAKQKQTNKQENNREKQEKTKNVRSSYSST
jgi:hypothetical protein